MEMEVEKKSRWSWRNTKRIMEVCRTNLKINHESSLKHNNKVLLLLLPHFLQSMEFENL